MKWERKLTLASTTGQAAGTQRSAPAPALLRGSANTGSSHGGAGTNCEGCHVEGCSSGQGQEGAPRGEPCWSQEGKARTKETQEESAVAEGAEQSSTVGKAWAPLRT